MRARVTIEQTFGILKRRFSVLQHSRMTPTSACHCVVACAVLHNIGTLDSLIFENFTEIVCCCEKMYWKTCNCNKFKKSSVV